MGANNSLRRLEELHAERDAIVQNYLATCTFEDGKLTTKGLTNLTQQMLNDAILKFGVMVEEGFEQRFDDIRFSPRLPCASPSELADFTLVNAIKGLKQSGSVTFHDLLGEMDTEIANLERRPILRHDVYMVLNAVPEEGFSPLTLAVGDAEVHLGKAQDIDEALSRADVVADRTKIAERVGFEHPIEGRLCLSVSLQARNDWYAGKTAQEIRDLVLALIELPMHERSMPLWTSGSTDAIDSLDSTVSFILDEKGGYHGGYYSYENPRARVIHIDRDSLIEGANRYSRASPDAQPIVRRAFSAFHHGITEKNPSFAFIFFWSALEQILLKEQNLDHFSMLQRLYRVIVRPSLIHEFEIGQLYKVRNAIIHDAEYYRAGPYHRNLIKLYTEPMLRFFLLNLADFNRDQIRLFYQKFDCQKMKRKPKHKHGKEEAAVFDRIREICKDTAEELES